MMKIGQQIYKQDDGAEAGPADASEEAPSENEDDDTVEAEVEEEK